MIKMGFRGVWRLDECDDQPTGLGDPAGGPIQWGDDMDTVTSGVIEVPGSSADANRDRPIRAGW